VPSPTSPMSHDNAAGPRSARIQAAYSASTLHLRSACSEAIAFPLCLVRQPLRAGPTVMFLLLRLAEAEGFEPPVPLGTLAFKSQGSRVPGYVPGCRPAASRAIRLAQCGARSSRLLHSCYTPTPKSSALRRCPEPHTVARLVVAGGPARTPLDRLAMGPGAVLAEPM